MLASILGFGTEHTCMLISILYILASIPGFGTEHTSMLISIPVYGN